MELRTTREMRRNVQLDKTMGRQSEAPKAAGAQSAQPKEPADKLTLSRQALAYAQEQNRRLWDAAREREQGSQGRIGGMLDAMETKKKELDSMSKNLKMMNKCQKIAAAIMRGDRVPPEDLQYLMLHDKEGYKMALALRRPKKDPKDVESVLDEEDRKGGCAEQTGDSGEAPAVESPGPSEGGGDASATEWTSRGESV